MLVVAALHNSWSVNGVLHSTQWTCYSGVGRVGIVGIVRSIHDQGVKVFEQSCRLRAVPVYNCEVYTAHAVLNSVRLCLALDLLRNGRKRVIWSVGRVSLFSLYLLVYRETIETWRGSTFLPTIPNIFYILRREIACNPPSAPSLIVCISLHP